MSLTFPTEEREAPSSGLVPSMVCYSVYGLGKTTFFRDLGNLFDESTYFLGTEPSHGDLRCRVDYPATWAEVVEAVNWFCSLPLKGNHFFCFDTVDELVELAGDHLRKKYDTDFIGDIGGPIGAEGWKMQRRMLSNLYSKLNQAGRIILGISHLEVREIKALTNKPQLQPSLTGKAGEKILKLAGSIVCMTQASIDFRDVKVKSESFLKTKRIRLTEFESAFPKLQEHERILICHPLPWVVCKVRTQGRPFPTFIPLPDPTENTAEPFVRVWQEISGHLKPGAKAICKDLPVQPPKALIEPTKTVLTGKIKARKHRSALRRR